jgi:peptidoglycan hydrolase-like protein with peptidoglycan-binding domain
MGYVYLRGSKGAVVQQIRQALATTLGEAATAYPGLSKGTDFDANTEAAVRQWQSGVGLLADGIVGPCCLQMLGVSTFKPLLQHVSSSLVSPLFPATKTANISRYLPYVTAALQAWDLRSRDVILAALGTIRAETEGFVPIAEFKSVYNTDPGQAPFNKYDRILGNKGPGEGALFKGRGFVQLTGRDNYQRYGDALGVDLIANPDLANAPEVAAALLASFLQSKLDKLTAALAKPDLKAARKLVNGGSHGLDRFSSVFDLAKAAWPLDAVLALGKVRGAKSTKGKAAKRVVDAAVKPTSKRPLTATKDAIDVRDRPYMPPPVSLMDAFPSDADVKALLPLYRKAELILDQGQEGACTGFGLASVINYLRWRKQATPDKLASVSPRMLYNLARRYDEYAGENYEGSSCRGAIKGWFNHGVCEWADWPYDAERTVHPRYGYATKARQNTLGVYYRIDTKLITDMQAAIQSVGAVYVSACTHDGWNQVPNSVKTPAGHDDLPLVPFDGRGMQGGGHAFALVGYNTKGFVLQNSWGNEWGRGGFAVLSYEDWLANAMDAWVVSLGVPGVVGGRATSPVSAGLAGSSVDSSRWWSQAKAYEHSVVLGNDGRVQRYLTEDERTRSLSHQVAILPDQWFRQQQGQGKKRLVIYAHGGLNSEEAAITRARAMGRFFLGNGCYPLFLVWKTGLLESISDIFSDWRRKQPTSAGLGDWVSDKTDRLIEASIGRKGARPIWSEMKENAAQAFAGNRGGDLLIKALLQLQATWGDQLEIHLVGHSAGSIILGHLVSAMTRSAQTQSAKVEDWVRGLHLYAPACTVQFANEHYATQPALLKLMQLSVLSDQVELDDNTAQIYRKSLLYLVSNALEADLRTPILGLHKVFGGTGQNDWDGSSSTAESLRAWRRAVDESSLLSRITVVDQDKVLTALPDKLTAAAHGAFDNDVAVLTRTIEHITGLSNLPTPVDDLRGF